MLNTAYCLAAFLAFIGGCAGNRVAWPLLASFTFYQVAVWQGWQFDRDLWAGVDCVVLAGIVGVFWLEWRKDRAWLPSLSDWVVLGLFAPLVYAYTLEPAPAHVLSMIVGTGQLLVLFPARKAWQLAGNASGGLSRQDDFFDLLRVAP